MLRAVLAVALLSALAVPVAAQTALTPVAPGVSVGQATPGVVPGVVSNGAPGMMQPTPAPVPESVPSNPVSAPSAVFESVPTANEQGYGAQEDRDALVRALEDQMALSTPRQKGEIVPAPAPANPVGKDMASREWLENWRWALTSLGMSQAKVNFEAARLDRAAFAAWASRQYWHRQAHNRVDVLGRPTQAANGQQSTTTASVAQ